MLLIKLHTFDYRGVSVSLVNIDLAIEITEFDENNCNHIGWFTGYMKDCFKDANSVIWMNNYKDRIFTTETIEDIYKLYREAK